MIRRRLFASAVLAAMALAGALGARAQTESAAKVGAVDAKRAVEESAAYRAAGEEWTAVLNRRMAEVRARQDELIAVQDRVAAAHANASESERARMIAEVEEIQEALARLNEGIQRDMNALRESLLRPVVERVGEVMRTYAMEHGFTLVVDLSNPAIAVAFMDDSADITDEILARLDEMDE